MQNPLGRNTVVLLGVGHTNAHVLRMWKMFPQPGARLICVSNYPWVTYSGMMPGVLAGQYPPAAMEIDLVRLATAANARLIVGQVTELDRENHRLLFADRPPLDFDLLSIGIGSQPTCEGVEFEGSTGVPIKPMQTFLPRLREHLSGLTTAPNTPPRIAIAGGGVGSLEIAFCLEHRARTNPQSLGLSQPPHIQLVTRSHRVGNGLREGTVRRIERELERRGIEIHTDAAVSRVDTSGLTTIDGQRIEATTVIWATGAVAPPLLKSFPLDHDAEGFLLIRNTLQTVTDHRIFAVGDSGTLVEHPTPKAGVYAVRQGPILWNNIQRLLSNHQPIEYHPQRDFLKLINLGDNRAIAEYRGISATGAVWWRLKDRIDRKFMQMYQEDTPMVPQGSTEETSDTVMRCLGCGGKVGGEILSAVLDELQIPPHPDVIIGLDRPDDAAIIRAPEGQLTVTTDFFAAPFDDPWLIGRIALLNAISDCFVMGARPTAALALMELPTGHPRAQLQILRELMQGCLNELERHGATLAGGHTIEGPRLTVGFTVLGHQHVPPRTKSNLRPGDQLILSKPVGTGALLAALMQRELPARHYLPMIDAMLLSNSVALSLLDSLPITAMTDVTGFGLAGHLIELLTASHVNAELELNKIPTLPGFHSVVQAGIESTLAPENRILAERVHWQGVPVDSPDTALLFDPQTSGGILFGVPAEMKQKALDHLNAHGFHHAAVIGQVLERCDDPVQIEVMA